MSSCCYTYIVRIKNLANTLTKFSLGVKNILEHKTPCRRRYQADK